MEQKTEKNDSFVFVREGLRCLEFREVVVYALIVGPILFEFSAFCCCKRADLRSPVVSRLIICGASFTDSPSQTGDNCVCCSDELDGIEGLSILVLGLLLRLLSRVSGISLVVICSSEGRPDPLVVRLLSIRWIPLDVASYS